MYETILTERRDAATLITLNRPHRLNAWTPAMHNDLFHAISACNEDTRVGALVITGAGRGYCAGADIKDNFKARLDGKEHQSSGDWISLVRNSKPLIAAVNGACVGVGATMTLPMDVIVASTQARFAMAFVKMGVTPELASSHFLVQRVGFGRAHEMCLTGRLYDGREAFEMRLADRLVDHDQLLDTAVDLANEMAANPGQHLRWVKQLITENGSETDIAKVHEREGAILAEAYKSPEHHEAVQAFIEKREPVFKR